MKEVAKKKYTSKELEMRAVLLANFVKSSATRLRQYAVDYDIKFPLNIADELDSRASEFLSRI